MEIHYGDWTVVQKIGSGSFGTVYEIERETLGFVQKAALKVISIPQSSSDVDAIRSTGMDEASIGEYYRDLASQIMLELKTMEQLKGHTNIVSYEDHEVRQKEDGFGWDIYIRMELLTPLSKYMLHHSMSRDEVIRLGIDLCRALERCEALNIIHRDIKPDNIFLSAQGDGELGDFGIARTVERTMSGMSKKGTYSYMAPEVYMGYPYGKTVDIYSLGLVLYRLLNYNRGPFLPAYPQPIKFQDQEQALVRRIKGERLPAPDQADEGLAEVVLRACSFDSSQRYSTAEEMRLALQTLLRFTSEFFAPAGGVSAGNMQTAPVESDSTVGGVPSEQDQQLQPEYPPEGKGTIEQTAGTVSVFDGQNQAPSGVEADRNNTATVHGQRLVNDRTVSIFKRSKRSGTSADKTDEKKESNPLKEDKPVSKESGNTPDSHAEKSEEKSQGEKATGLKKWNGILRAAIGAAIGGFLFCFFWSKSLLPVLYDLPVDGLVTWYEVYHCSAILIPLLSWLGYLSAKKIMNFTGLLAAFAPAVVSMFICICFLGGFEYYWYVIPTLKYFLLGIVPAVVIMIINRKKSQGR